MRLRISMGHVKDFSKGDNKAKKGIRALSPICSQYDFYIFLTSLTDISKVFARFISSVLFLRIAVTCWDHLFKNTRFGLTQKNVLLIQMWQLVLNTVFYTAERPNPLVLISNYKQVKIPQALYNLSFHLRCKFCTEVKNLPDQNGFNEFWMISGDLYGCNDF